MRDAVFLNDPSYMSCPSHMCDGLPFSLITWLTLLLIIWVTHLKCLDANPHHWPCSWESVNGSCCDAGWDCRDLHTWLHWWVCHWPFVTQSSPRWSSTQGLVCCQQHVHFFLTTFNLLFFPNLTISFQVMHRLEEMHISSRAHVLRPPAARVHDLACMLARAAHGLHTLCSLAHTSQPM